MKSKDRKEQIVQITISLVGEFGLSGITTARLAETAGISEAALYKHFKNKEAILEETVDTIGTRLTTTIENIKSENIPGISKLEKIFMTHMQHIQVNKGVPRIIYTPEVHSDELLRKKIFSIIQFYLKTISGILKEGIKDKSINKEIDCNIESKRFLSMIQFSAFRYSLSGFDSKMMKEGTGLWKSFHQSVSGKK